MYRVYIIFGAKSRRAEWRHLSDLLWPHSRRGASIAAQAGARGDSFERAASITGWPPPEPVWRRA
eukprot:NODE_9324_length_346_cov_0.848797.p3 GENE.NODE_9324_length_346_cov_0.848797~~NODE_9324_length_346_cov_0.848797.p3  ORF type:complete len:65 (-),score=6.16 NODE_9324_length_346_cov_0.848797:72-266(-)